MQRFVAPKGAPSKALVAISACVSPTQCNLSWLQRELHRRPWGRCPHAFPPPGTAARGPTTSTTEGPRLRPH
eukprot:3394329-Pyramimonas_sp.AAC.1